jgi:glutamine amidotransferase
MANLQVAVVNYGMGNLGSVRHALNLCGADVVVVSEPAELRAVDAIVLPGVGAFDRAYQNLTKAGMADAITHHVMTGRKPFLGICLGMQLITQSSAEYGFHKGLGWIDATTVPLTPEKGLRLPHIGWTDLQIVQGATMFEGITERDVYFVHSYHVVCSPSIVTATCQYGQTITAAIHQDNIMATQFHLEKSSYTGLKMLNNFMAFAKGAVHA